MYPGKQVQLLTSELAICTVVLAFGTGESNAHDAHVVLSVVDAKNPTAQAVQSKSPMSCLKYPGRQLVQALNGDGSFSSNPALHTQASTTVAPSVGFVLVLWHAMHANWPVLV